MTPQYASDKPNDSDRNANGAPMDSDRSMNMKSKQLADMLGVALESVAADSLSPDELMAELLRNKLDGPLPPDPITAIRPSSVLDNIYNELAIQSRRTLGDELVDPETDLGTILLIKDHAKQTAAEDRPKAQRNVAITVYYAAIASALLFHDRKITTHSYDTIAITFAKLIEKPWMPPVLIEHLNSARRTCLDRKDQQGDRI
jgi:hypothetical protein